MLRDALDDVESQFKALEEEVIFAYDDLYDRVDEFVKEAELRESFVLWVHSNFSELYVRSGCLCVF